MLLMLFRLQHMQIHRNNECIYIQTAAICVRLWAVVVSLSANQTERWHNTNDFVEAGV